MLPDGLAGTGAPDSRWGTVSAAATIGPLSSPPPSISVPSPSRVVLRNPGAVESVRLWVWDADARADAPVVLLGHGAGAPADHPVHVGVCTAIARAGLPVATFNFAYAEAGRRSPDRTERLLDCFRDAADAVMTALPGRPVLAGGRSMGGRMASLLAAEGHPFSGLVLLNYPLVGIRSGPDSPPRVDHWPRLDLPVLFVHGTRDRLLPAELFERHRGTLPGPVTVHVVDGADHSFGVPRSSGRTAAQVYDEVAGAVAAWASAVTVRA